MFHREGLDLKVFIDRVQNGKQVSRFCLDPSWARKEKRVISKKSRKLEEQNKEKKSNLNTE